MQPDPREWSAEEFRRDLGMIDRHVCLCHNQAALPSKLGSLGLLVFNIENRRQRLKVRLVSIQLTVRTCSSISTITEIQTRDHFSSIRAPALPALFTGTGFA
jgi:hypothetical protein